MTLPTHYTDLIKQMRDHYDAEEKKVTEQVTNQLSSIRTRRKENADKITDFTARYMDTGVFISDWAYETYEKPHRAYGGRYGTTLNKYAKELAHSLRRPFVRLYGNRLLVPKTKKLSILTTPLMFVAKQCESTYRGANENGVSQITAYTSMYYYWFNGPVGDEWKSRWLEYIKEPECRAALGLLQR